MDYFDTKSPEEIDTFSVNFASRLLAGETLVDASFSLSVVSGTDADANQMLDGLPFVNDNAVTVKTAGGADVVLAAKTAVLQSLKLGVHACEYELVFQATTSTGRKLSKHMRLKVRNEGS